MVRKVPHYTPTSPVVSVLMAVHDAEGSVRRAVESVQNQSMRNLELIVVDTGSGDSTLRQLDAIAERDMRVRVVRADGCSYGAALDLALDRAVGTYVAVVDDDGWMLPTMLAELVGRAAEKRLDLAIGGYTLTVSDGSGRESEFDVSSEEVTYSTQHDFRAAAWRLLASGQLLPAGGKLFSLERARAWGVRFSPEGGGARTSEHAFVIGFLRRAERVGVLPGACYHVDRSVARLRSAGALEGYRRLEAEHDELLGLYRAWGLEGDGVSMETLQNRYLEQLVGCIESLCRVGSPVSSVEQKRLVSGMLGTDHARLASSVAHPHTAHARSMVSPIRSGNTALVCVQARLLSLFGRAGAAEVAPDSLV